MIELTKTSFDALITRFGLGPYKSIIIIKAHLSNSSCIANLETYFTLNSFDQILVFPVSTLRYASDISSLTPSATKTSNLYIESIGVFFQLHINNILEDDYYVIYSFAEHSNNIDIAQFFNDVDVISVDYVGNLFTVTGLNGDYTLGTTLKEVNLSSNYKTSSAVDSESNLFIDNYFPSGININFGNFNATEFNDGALSGVPVKKFVFPASEETYEIPANCLSDCVYLEEVYIPDTCVTAIGDGAFSGCSNLKYIYIGSGVANIGDGAFSGCYDESLRFDVSLSNTHFLGELGCLLRKNSDNTYNLMYATHTWFTTAGLGNCHVVPATTFSPALPTRVGYLTTLISAGNTETATTISGNTITGLVRITERYYDSYISQYPNAISGFYIPVFTLIKEIEESACAGNPYITSLDFYLNNLYPWTYLNTIGDNAFSGCSALTTVTLPPENSHAYLYNNITLGEEVFTDCSALTTVSVNRNVSIDTKAFYNSGLTSISFKYNPTFPSTSYEWFANTPNLAKITCSGTYTNNTTDGTYSIAFVNISTPCNAIMKRENGAWSLKVGCSGTNFRRISTTYSCAKIGSYAFYGCSNLTIGNLSATYKTIGDYTFYKCTSLDLSLTATANFLKNLQYIGRAAFYGCTGIEQFVSNSLVELDEEAFADSGLTYINLPSTVTHIAENAFDGCVLETVIITDSSFAHESTEDGINALIRRSASGIPNSLLKSGNQSQIVNQPPPAVTPKIIYPESFAGVDFKTVGESQTNALVIASDVDVIGSHCLDKSKRNGGTTPEENYNKLLLKTNTEVVNNAIELTNANINALLFLLGGKYFKKMVDDTIHFRLSNQTYYYVDYNSTTHQIVLYEKVPNTPPLEILGVGYESSTSTISVTTRNVPYYNYATGGSVTHVQPITNFLPYSFEHKIDLFIGGQIITREMQDIYFEIGPNCSKFVPGSTWQGGVNGTNITIPQITYSSNVTIKSGYYGDIYNSNPIKTNEAFANCGWLEVVTTDRNLSDYSTNGNPGNVEGMFKDCTNLAVLEFSRNGNIENIHFGGKISKSMFEGCTNLYEIDIIGGDYSGGVHTPLIYDTDCFKNASRVAQGEINWYQIYGTTFNAGSFENIFYNSTMNDMLLLQSPTYIDPQAFKGNNYVQTEAVTTTGYYFTGCGNCIVDKTNSIVVGSHGYDLSTCKGIGDYAFYKIQLPNNKKAITITNKTGFKIGESAFAESNITSYTESGTTRRTQIGDSAFNKCLSLTSVTLINDCILGNGSFSGCTALSSLNLASGISISDNCFNGCTALTSVVTTSDVGVEAFADCTNLTTVTIGGDISANAFSGCTNLTTLRLNYNSNAIADIDASAFNNCPITTINIDGSSTFNKYTIKTHGIYHYYTKNNINYLEFLLGIGSVTGTELINDNENWTKILKKIGAHAFDGRGLTGEFIIPGTVTIIGDYAFANNPGLENVIIPPSVEYIGDHAFDGCTSLHTLTIPDSCTYIGAAAFKDCSLDYGINCNTVDNRYYTEPQNFPPATTIGSGAYIDGAINLVNCRVYSIDGDAFSGSRIRNFRYPKSVIKTHYDAFRNCTYLTEVHFYTSAQISGLTDNNIFYGCSNLCDIYYHSTTTPTGTLPSNTFYGVGSAQSNNLLKHLHLPVSGVPGILNTDFYSKLNALGFTIVYDIE